MTESLVDLQAGADALKIISSSARLLGAFHGFNIGPWRTIRHRSDRDRRQNSERRIGSIARRLRYGLKLEFYRQTGIGPQEPISTAEGFGPQIESALARECSKYVFSVRSLPPVLMPPGEALRRSIECVLGEYQLEKRSSWVSTIGSPTHEKTVILLEAIAGHLCSWYEVKPKDRRVNDRRRA
jgi:hypothetical protein